MNEMQLHNNKFNLQKLKLDLNRKVLVEVIQWLFFLLFLYSAGYKYFDFEKFNIQLEQSPIFTGYSKYVSIGILTVELAVAIIVIIPKTALIGLYSSFSLMVMFTAYIIVVIHFSEFTPCGCNGILKGATWNQHFLFNITFVLLGGLAIFLYPKLENKGTKP